MAKGARGRDPKRLLIRLQENFLSDRLRVEVVPLAAIPEQVKKRAILLPRRPKGVAKAKRVY